MSIDADEIIIMTDENGKEEYFEFIDLIPYKDKSYVALLPVVDGEETDEVVILRCKKSKLTKKETYVSVDDDKVLAEVFELFMERNKDKFNFVD